MNKRVLFHKLWAGNPPYNLYFANWTCSFSLFSRANLRFFFEFSKLFLHFFSSSGHFSRKSSYFPLEGWEKRGNQRKTFYNYCYSLASEKANEKQSAQQSKNCSGSNDRLGLNALQRVSFKVNSQNKFSYFTYIFSTKTPITISKSKNKIVISQHKYWQTSQ